MGARRVLYSPGIMRTHLKGDLSFDVSAQFKNIEDLNLKNKDIPLVLSSLLELDPKVKSTAKKTDFHREGTQVIITCDKQRFSRKVIVVDSTAYLNELEKVEAAKDMNDLFKWSYVYHFPQKIKNHNFKEAVISEDRQSIF